MGLALAAWGLAGVIALCGALTFAALGQRYNANGAQYEVLRDCFGPCPAFLFVFCNATAIQAGAIGVIALVCASNLLALGGVIEAGSGVLLAAALGLIAVVTATNAAGVKWGSRVQIVTVVAKVLALACIVGLAVIARPEVAPGAPAERAPKAIGGFGGVIAALVPAFFAYGGWQQALWISGEVREPRRTLPRAILGGVLIVVVVYLASNWAYLALLGPQGVSTSKALAADAVSRVFPEWGRRAIAAAVAISAFGVLNAQLLSGPRLIYGMAADGRFFRPFARIHPRLGTPVPAIVLLGAVGAGLLVAAGGADGVERLVAGSVFVDGVFFALTGIALLTLRGTPEQPLLPGAKAAAGVFVLGELGVLVGAFLAADMRAAAISGAAWIAAAAVVYAAWFSAKPR